MHLYFCGPHQLTEHPDDTRHPSIVLQAPPVFLNFGLGDRGLWGDLYPFRADRSGYGATCPEFPRRSQQQAPTTRRMPQ
eukprot:350862-Prorocentrum_minimum.AAC.11